MNEDDYENRLLLSQVPALVGAVSPNFRRVSLSLTEDGLRMEFVLKEESAEDREEIADIYIEFEALMDGPTPAVIDVLVTTEELEKIPINGRVVFGRKEP